MPYNSVILHRAKNSRARSDRQKVAVVDQKLPRIAPSFRPQSFRIVLESIVSERKRTVPSPRSACTPPVCRLKGSLFGPQLLTVHGQDVGPPAGVLLPLMTLIIVP